MANNALNRFERESQLYPLPKVPLDALYVDHFGPLQETPEKYKYILVAIDAFTRFTWLFPTKSTSSKESIDCLENIFTIFGNPTELISDRGTTFTSKEFTESTVGKGIKHRKVAVAAPWANGTVERVNRFLKSSLTKLIESPDEWKSYLGKMQYVINNTYHSVVKSSPARLMLGFDQRSHTDHSLTSFTKDLVTVDKDLEKERDLSRDNALRATDLVRAYNKEYKDAHSIKPTLYKPGDYVLIRDTIPKIGTSSKLKPNYKGPYVIAKSLGSNRYVIKDIPGFNIKQKPLDTILSSDRIKPWIKIGKESVNE